jgi:hypothetical protein
VLSRRATSTIGLELDDDEKERDVNILGDSTYDAGSTTDLELEFDAAQFEKWTAFAKAQRAGDATGGKLPSQDDAISAVIAAFEGWLRRLFGGGLLLI